ncbi:MAG TPA: GntG family PLP-dependent aldolase [Puia sp.]|nr:GntG family PLP-dependent aldolase [Puia sp.]
MQIDFRSDTVTLPTTGMREAMMNAAVGDDVFGEDPSVNQLESMAAQLFEMEAALFCPSGTMSNQIAIKCHTQPGDEVICERQAHVCIYEGGGIAFNSGAQARTIEGDRGMISATQVEAVINPDDVHKARTSLVCLENTSNRGGGSCYDLDEIRKIRKICDTHGLRLHLDGARLFNALVAKDETAGQYGKIFDSISVCLNKGLGCPIGSLLIGSAAFIRKARRVRKVLGGGMRQAGFMAAAGIYALEQQVERLAQDHTHAKLLASELSKKTFVKNMMPVETNIVIFETPPEQPAKIIAQRLLEKHILVIAISPSQVRFVTHQDITGNMLQQAIDIIRHL